MQAQNSEAAAPPIYLLDSEADTISDLAWTSRDRFPDVCDMLMDEIGRATLCSPDDLPENVVTMGTEVEYRDERSESSRRIQLVYPNHADVEQGRISILTPVGAALLGLQAGTSIVWPDRDGGLHSLSVERVFR